MLSQRLQQARTYNTPNLQHYVLIHILIIIPPQPYMSVVGTVIPLYSGFNTMNPPCNILQNTVFNRVHIPLYLKTSIVSSRSQCRVSLDTRLYINP